MKYQLKADTKVLLQLHYVDKGLSDLLDTKMYETHIFNGNVEQMLTYTNIFCIQLLSTIGGY